MKVYMRSRELAELPKLAVQPILPDRVTRRPKPRHPRYVVLVRHPDWPEVRSLRTSDRDQALLLARTPGHAVVVQDLLTRTILVGEMAQLRRPS